MIHTHAVPSFLPCSLRVFDACHGFCREIALFLALPPPFLRINVKLHSPLSLLLLILRHPLILLVIGTSEKNIRFEQFVLLSVGKIVIYPESLYPTVYYTYIYIYIWRKQIRCTNICLRGSRKHRLIVIYWTLSARELRDRTRFFECAKRCPFIISIHVHAWYTSLRGKEGAQLDRGVERVGAQRLVGNKSGRWRRKALSGARVRKRKRQWYIVRPGTRRPGGARIASVSDLTHTRNRPSTSARCSQFKHSPWRQSTGCHPVTFWFRNISSACLSALVHATNHPRALKIHWYCALT